MATKPPPAAQLLSPPDIDADTIGAIVGSLAGAYGGRDAIPDAWAVRTQVSAGKCIGFVAGMEIEKVAERLVAAREERQGDKVTG